MKSRFNQTSCSKKSVTLIKQGEQKKYSVYELLIK